MAPESPAEAARRRVPRRHGQNGRSRESKSSPVALGGAAAGVTGIIAAGANGVGQAAQNFGFRNATRAANAVEQRVFPQIIGRPTDAQRVIEQAGQRAQEIQRAAAQDIEQFAAEQAAAETAEITPLLAETGAGAGAAAAGEAAAAGAAGVGGALEVLGGAVGAALAPEVAIPAAIGVAAGAGEEPWPAAAARADRRLAHRRHLQAAAGWQPLLGEHWKVQEPALQPSRRPAILAELAGQLWAGLGQQHWVWALAPWAARTKARGT